MKAFVVISSTDSGLQQRVTGILGEDFVVEKCSGPTELAERLKTKIPALIFIDSPPSEDQKELYRQWITEFRKEARNRKVPILLLSDSLDETKWLYALSLGVSDFIMRPLNEREFRLRVMGLTRSPSHPSQTGDIWECGNLKLNLASYEVLIGEQSITLSVLEFNLLRYFISNRDHVLAREQVIAAVWPNSEVLDRAVDTHVVSLRRKLTGWDYSIVTVYRAGYILKKEDH